MFAVFRRRAFLGNVRMELSGGGLARAFVRLMELSCGDELGLSMASGDDEEEEMVVGASRLEGVVLEVL